MLVLKILIGISVVITIGILFAGTFSMTRAESDGRRSNMLMRYRVVSQLITVLLIVLYLWLN